MSFDKVTLRDITKLANAVPDPKRAETNLQRLLEADLSGKRFLPYLKEITMLFSASQFLANFTVSCPDELFTALKGMDVPVTKKFLAGRAAEELVFGEEPEIYDVMKKIRSFRKRYMLRITLRDIMGETDIPGSMDELTGLAEVIIEAALSCSLRMTARQYGEPEGGAVSLIALGKLGGEELNYSSDIDLMAVYSPEEGQTSGIQSLSDAWMNRIGVSEFYFKVIELFSRVLSRNTEDGIAYRVDLRLRPQGERGELALPLRSYETYYKTWGRTWERMALIRARPVAGDPELGRHFLETIGPFVWKRSADYSDIEEIRALKKKIDSSFSKEDIKRGYGGIREAEFFIQTFQLVYGGAHESLRTHRLFNALQSLRWLGLVPEQDLVTLWENYLYLRRVEHFLQMKNDLQTHSLPAAEADMLSVAGHAGFSSVQAFLSDLKIRRMKTRSMYNTLLGTQEDVHAEALAVLEGDLTDDELTGYLSFRKLRDPAAALMNLKGIKRHTELFRTQQERTTIRKVVPQLIETALNSEDPDRALKGLESFMAATGIRETYLSGLMERKELREGVMRILSLSTYLSRIFLSSTRYLDLLLEGNIIRKPLNRTKEELQRCLSSDHYELGIAEYKNVEEIRLGSFFLMHVVPVRSLVRSLSYLADSIISAIVENSGRHGSFTVVGMGKLGSREITFGSDLDLIFVSETMDDLKSVEKVLKTLTAYTDRGIIYNVDTRLRPDGSKGTLLKDIRGYRDYYLDHAHPWEIQALLKVRPVAGDRKLAQSFASMAREVILKRASELRRDDVISMRERIVRELARESEGIDIKLGPGGIEEIEFYVQWLQLENAARYPEILVQDTGSAIRRLTKRGVLGEHAGKILSDSYQYLRTLETLMRLNEEQVLARGSDFAVTAAGFMGHKKKDELFEHLMSVREKVLDIVRS